MSMDNQTLFVTVFVNSYDKVQSSVSIPLPSLVIW